MVMQRKAVRLVLKKPLRSHIGNSFSRLSILSLENLWKAECIKIMYRYHNNTLPIRVCQLFTLNHAIHNYRTRQANNPHVFRFNYTSFKETFLYQSSMSWAGIPPNVKVIATTWPMLSSWYRRQIVADPDD